MLKNVPKLLHKMAKKLDLFLKDGDHHGRGGGVADPHGEEGGRQHEPQHQKPTRYQPG
jgi:hypothetical protein